MNNSTRSVLIFVSGLVIGAIFMYELVKTKFEEMANDEIESVKQMYHEKLSDKKEESDNQQEEIVKAVSEANQFVDAVNAMYDYTGRSKEKKEVEKDMNTIKPYVISPDDFSEIDEYSVKSLNYYTDGVVTDESGKIISDIDNIIGRDSLDHFGEYEEDCVYVRNDELQTDFEILRDYRAYSDIR